MSQTFIYQIKKLNTTQKQYYVSNAINQKLKKKKEERENEP